MADEPNEEKAFLTWEESVVVLQTDARQGIVQVAGNVVDVADIRFSSY